MAPKRRRPSARQESEAGSLSFSTPTTIYQYFPPPAERKIECQTDLLEDEVEELQSILHLALASVIEVPGRRVEEFLPRYLDALFNPQLPLLKDHVRKRAIGDLLDYSRASKGLSVFAPIDADHVYPEIRDLRVKYTIQLEHLATEVRFISQGDSQATETEVTPHQLFILTHDYKEYISDIIGNVKNHGVHCLAHTIMEVNLFRAMHYGQQLILDRRHSPAPLSKQQYDFVSFSNMSYRVPIEDHTQDIDDFDMENLESFLETAIDGTKPSFFKPLLSIFRDAKGREARNPQDSLLA